MLTAINCISVKAAARVQIVFTIAKLLAIGIIIIGGFVRLGQKNTDILRSGFQGTTKNVGKIAIGLYNGLWSYDGWLILFTFVTYFNEILFFFIYRKGTI